MSQYPQRREALRDRLDEAGLDALLVTSLVNIRYLSGFTGSAASLLVLAGGADVLATDGRYREQALAEAPDVMQLINPARGWPAEHLPDGATVGLESTAISWAQALELKEALPQLRLEPMPGVVEELRQCKSDEEVDLIARACAIADAAFADLVERLAPGRTERDIAVALERAMVDRGASAPAFATIVASGPNSAVPHHTPTDRVLQRGDLLKLDFGALVDGYHSDMTRMLVFGHPDPELRKVFDVVRDAQAEGLAAAQAGTTCGAVDAACRGVIAAAGYGEHFVHGTGHGVGLQIHEDPFVRKDAVATLRPGMVVTVEPGVYLPGRGGVRIEDTLAVTAEGARVLTRTPKDLLVL